ncbi:MAG: 2-dehydropantoate 2-reductase [Planctomycetes bacterium]|nr:2-dehydropantoate 2-reductase [Planctomycetota bacterium]
MRIVIVGTGAVGGYFGARFAHAGEDVFFLARGPHLEAMQARGLRIESVNGPFTVAVKASSDPKDAGKADLLVVCVKTYDTRSACEPCRAIVRTDTTVLTIQNGLGNAERLAEIFPGSLIVPGVAYVATEVVAPGVIRHDAAGRLVIGSSPRSEAIKAAFDRAGAACEIAETIEQAVWEKLLGNAVMNVFAAADGCELGDLLVEPRRETAEQAIDELTAVAAAQGIVVRPSARERAWRFCEQYPRFKTSTQQDVLRGRPTEVEAFNGEIIRLGRKLGVPTPTHEMLYAKLRDR